MAAGAALWSGGGVVSINELQLFISHSSAPPNLCARYSHYAFSIFQNPLDRLTRQPSPFYLKNKRAW
jgi:hypothetical protein